MCCVGTNNDEIAMNNNSDDDDDDDGCDGIGVYSETTYDDGTDELRFKVGDRVECIRGQSDSMTGTVVGLWLDIKRKDRHDVVVPRDEERLVPYLVRLDDGQLVHVLADDDEAIKRSSIPPLVATFKRGTRVECKMGNSDEWIPATVIICNESNIVVDNNIPYHVPPYAIRLDDGEMKEFWGPKDCIRLSNIPAPKERKILLRFKLGDRVECLTGEGWMSGTIIRTHYNDVSNEMDYKVPYQIQLDTGNLIFAPLDMDTCIRRSNTPPPSCWICFDNEISEDNFIVRECACRGEENGFVHIDCLVKLAVSKTENINYIGIHDTNPFEYCITCKQEFSIGSRSSAKLAEECYRVHRNDPIGSYWNTISTKLMSKTFTNSGDHDGSKKLLQKQITLYRTEIARVPCWERSKKDDLILDTLFFLKELADIHGETGSVKEMKSALDESLVLVAQASPQVSRDDVFGCRMNTLASLGRHAHLIDDKRAALRYYEKCISLAKQGGISKAYNSGSSNMCFYLVNSALLNLELGNKACGVQRLSEALVIHTTIYGRAASEDMAESLHMLRTGSMNTVDPANVGLGMLPRQQQLARENLKANASKSSQGKPEKRKGKKKGKKKRR